MVSLIHWIWVGKFDGNPYPIKGSPSFDTLTYKPVNDRTNDTTATNRQGGDDGRDYCGERREVARGQAYWEEPERTAVH